MSLRVSGTGRQSWKIQQNFYKFFSKPGRKNIDEKLKSAWKRLRNFPRISMASLVWWSLGFAIQAEHVQVNRIKYSAENDQRATERAHIFTFLPIDREKEKSRPDAHKKCQQTCKAFRNDNFTQYGEWELSFMARRQHYFNWLYARRQCVVWSESKAHFMNVSNSNRSTKGERGTYTNFRDIRKGTASERLRSEIVVRNGRAWLKVIYSQEFDFF